MTRLALLRAALAAIALSPAAAFAQPAAILIEVEGKTLPEAWAFKELSAGESLSLEPGARVTLSHYRSCREITVEGGEISVAAAAATLSGGTLVAERQASCAAAVDMSEGDLGNAGVVLRGVTDGDAVEAPLSLTAGPTPGFMIRAEERGGPGASWLAIRSGGILIRSLEIEEGMAAWPEGAAPLSPGSYEVQIGRGDDGIFHSTVIEVGSEGAGRVVLRP